MLKRVAWMSVATALAMCGLAMAQDKAPEPKPESKPAAGAPAPAPKPEAAPEAAPEDKGPTLKVGDKAPALEVEKFLKGTPVTKFEEGKVYVVEFWATWCPPCLKSIPHLTELQAKFADKGLTIIGVDVSEDRRAPYDDTTADTVGKFIEGQGEKMVYTVAFDGASKKMDKAYMEASRSQGIPTAFIIDGKGVVAYIGHPMEMESTLESVVAGKHDIKKLAEEYAGTLEAQALMGKLQKAVQDGNEDEFYTIANKMMAIPGKGDPQALFAVAWLSSSEKSPMKKKDLDLALKAADRVNAATEGKEPSVVATLAQIHFQKGDEAEANELIAKAIELASKDEQYARMVDQLKKKQEEYKAAK